MARGGDQLGKTRLLASSRQSAASTVSKAGRERPANPSEGERSLIPVAEVARAHGIRGELRLKLFNEESTLLSRGREVVLRFPDGGAREYTILAARRSNKALLVLLNGVESRNDADALQKAEVCVPRSAFPSLPDDELYVCDLEGATAILRSGEEIGWVRGVESYPTCDVLVIERKIGGTLEAPLLESFIGRMDVEHGVVEILTLEGLE